MNSSLNDILHLSARITGHADHQKKIRELTHGFSDWETLLREAELEGIAPLLHKHLKESESSVPVTARRGLALLVARHKQHTDIRNKVLLEALKQLACEEIAVLVLKGAALCHTLYPEPYLRPMRDIDILVDKNQADKAQAVLLDCGFLQSTGPIPADHFHLPPVSKTVDNMTVCIEVHRGLFPNCPPYYPALDFSALLEKAKKFLINGCAAQTFGDEDMLRYLYDHGFRAPLTYEGYRLVNVADFIGLIENSYTEFNWKELKAKQPRLCKALPMMHHFSPWNPQMVPTNFVTKGERAKQRIPTRFQGWPKVKMKTHKRQDRKLNKILAATFIPPTWWFKVYYGLATPIDYVYCLIIEHPKNIFWWVKLHSSFLEQPEEKWSRHGLMANKMKAICLKLFR